jgi:hypothetical protein
MFLVSSKGSLLLPQIAIFAPHFPNNNAVSFPIPVPFYVNFL